MTPCSEVYVYTVVAVVAACLTTTAGAPADTSSCPNLSDGAPQYYDDQDGRCYPCPRCDPGEGLSEVCGDGLGKNARCQPCPDESFQPVSAASVCITCRRCDNTMDDSIDCTPTTDRKCGECKIGYFRHDPRNDHCVRCQDEKSSQNYPDCLRTTPPQQASTTYIPSPTEGPLMSPVAIVLIVILALVVCAIIIIVLFWKCRHRTCSCRVSSLCHRRKKRPRHTILKVRSMSEPANPESQPKIQQMPPEQMQRGTPTVHSSQYQHSEVHVDLEVGQEDPEYQPETEPLIIPVPGHDLTETPSGPTVESMQSAIPTDPSQYLLSKAQQPTQDSDPQSADDAVDDNDNPNDQNGEEGSEENPQHRDAEASAPQDSDTSNIMHDSDRREMEGEVNRRCSEESSSSKATQTSLDSNSPSASPDEALGSEDEEDKHRRFLERFDQAIKCTEGVSISKMNREDINLLHENMYEQPENLRTSDIFHYARFAELFDIHKNQIRMFRNAEDVLHHLEATKMVEMTVDKILEKLKDCGKCYNIVRELVDQILKREQPNAG